MRLDFGFLQAQGTPAAEFIEKFQEVKEAIQAQMTGKGVANGNSGACTPVASATASPLLAARSAADDNAAISPATVPAPAPPSHKSDNDDNMVHQRAHSVSSSIQGGYATVGRAPRGPLASAGANIEPPQGETTEQQLRYENDRLKLALAQR
ncbi:hypothetical protein O0L34_g1850 [Tuta absoluta]|nr:hypothetical protein O0L34_g1850 [Tuta absoluta]